MSYSNYDLNTKITALGSKTSAIIPSPFNVLDVVDTVIVEDGLGTGNNTTITPVEVSLTDGVTGAYSSSTANGYVVDDLTKSTTIHPNYMEFDKVGDHHQVHIDNTQVHILDIVTLDEMFLDHNSLILVQPSTTHQTELLGNMLDFQTPENVVSCGHTTYQNGAAGFEVYDLTTGNNSLLTYGGLTLSTTIATNALTSEYWTGPIRSEATVMNANHYVLGSMTSGSVYDKPQKSANIYFNPSLQTLYSTTFSGNLTGIASSANTVNINTYNLSNTCYIPFTSSAAGLGKALYVDDTTGPLTYNPSTGVLTATNFTGAVTGNSTSASTVSTIAIIMLDHFIYHL